MLPDLDDIGGALELSRHRLAIAREDLAAAELDHANKHYRAANNRAYYAVFRAVSACLALRFKAYASHAQVLGNFNKDFVHTGIFPKEISRKISRCQEIRHYSDYDDFYIASAEEAAEQIGTAREVIDMIGEYLSERARNLGRGERPE